MFGRKKTYSNKDLIQGCAKNSRRHQEALYRQYFGGMTGLILHYVKDKDKALEIVNEGFLKVFKKIHTVEDPEALAGWIKTIMMRTRADYFKKNNKYLKAVILEEVKDDRFENSTMEDLYFKDIVRLLDKLPPATAEVFRLYAIEGFKHDEIAEQLGISAGTSKWHLSAARQKLRELIEQFYDRERNVG